MRKFFYKVCYFLSPLLPIAALYQANPDRYAGNLIITFAMIAGASAYTWLILQFVLSARPKRAEIHFGMDRLYRVHGLMGVIAIISILLHQTVYEEQFGETWLTSVGTVGMGIFIGVGGITILLMVNSFITKIFPINWVRKTIESFKIFKYEHYILVHNLTVVGLILMVTHVLLSSSAQNSSFVFAVFLGYFVLGAVFYLYHKFIKYRILEKKWYVVNDVTQESNNMWCLKFEPEKGEIIKYKPGQFGFYKVIGEKISAEEHPFSLSSSPTNGSHLSVTVKELGDFTSKIKNVKKGDHVLVDAPYGRFTYLVHPKEEATVFIVGGVGITPALSMLRYMRDAEPDRKALLIWGMNTMNDFIHREEFENMANEMKNLHVVPVVSRDKEWEGYKGHIDYEKIKRILDENGMPANTGFYLCGPPMLMDSTIKNLKLLGIKNKYIHFEKFSL